MIAAPSRRVSPPPNPSATATAVIPTIHQAAKIAIPEAEPMPRMTAGRHRPTRMLALLELSDSLTHAAPRPWRASRTAAIRFGMLVGAADDRGERREDCERVDAGRRAGELVAAGVLLLLCDRGAKQCRQSCTGAGMQCRDRHVRSQREHREPKSHGAGQHVDGDETADDGDKHGNAAREDESVSVDPHGAGQQGRQPEQAGDVEDVRADDDANTGVFVAGDDGGDGGADLGRIRAERGEDPQQGLGEPEPLADAVELAGEHDARRDGERERADKKQDSDGDRHGFLTLAAASGRLLRRARDRDRRRAVG